MRRVVPAWVLLLAVSGGGCGGAGAEGPQGNFPPYGGHAADLFDDNIEPQAVGDTMAASGTDPRTDNLLRERTQVGDVVLRVRVMTVTEKRDDDGGRSWELSMHTQERLAGDHPPKDLGTDFVLRVDRTDPAAGIMRAFESSLVDKRFVAFLREFARQDNSGEPDLHFHLAPDDKNELEAVKAAVLMGEVQQRP
jgi:hypothetical protein